MIVDGRDWPLILHRHLEGSLEDDDARALEERLTTDPALCRLLAELATDQAQLREMLEGERPATEPAPARWSRGSLAAAASILIAVAVALVIGLRPKPPIEAPVKPAAAPRTDTGRITGRVLRMGDGLVLTLEVPSSPELSGRKIKVVPGRKPNGDGELQPDRDHLNYFRKLQPGMEVTLDLLRLDTGEYAVGQLTPEQIDWANQKVEKKKSDGRKIPDREK